MEKMLEKIKKHFVDSESVVSGNETYEIIKHLYPGITAESTYYKIEKELMRFYTVLKIAHLIESYKKNQDYIIKNTVPINLISLLITADESISFSEFSSDEWNASIENFNKIEEEQLRISTQLVDLGFNKFDIFENERNLSSHKGKIVPRNNMDDKTYYTKLFSLSNDFVELMTLYCVNTPYKKGMKYDKLQLIHKLLLQKTKATPNSYDWFYQRIKKRYQTLGLSDTTNKGGL